jgi:hypothetical protein
VLDGDQASHVERRPDLNAAPLDLALAAVSSAVAVHRGDTGQGLATDRKGRNGAWSSASACIH